MSDGIQSYMKALSSKESPKQYEKYLLESAQQGYQPAMLALADYYFTDNPNKAMRWYKELAQQDIPHAMYRMGECCLALNDKRSAFNWLSEAVKAGDVDALYSMTQFGELTDDVIKWMFEMKLSEGDYTSAWRVCNLSKDIDPYWSRMVESTDSPQALINEVDSCIELYLPEDPERSLQWHIRCSELDDADSLYIVGRCYLTGKGADRSYVKAMEYFLRASDLNSYRAMYSVGRMYQLGLGVKKLDDTAKEWYLKIPMIDYPMASYRIAEIDGVKNIFDELGTDFVDLLELFAKGNDAESQFYLGEFYHWLYSYDDMSYRSIDRRSLQYYRKSAENGYAEAQNLMGIVYYKGTDFIKPSEEDAIRWFRMSSKNGNDIGTFYLALILFKKGDAESRTEALGLLKNLYELNSDNLQEYRGDQSLHQ